jgi:hypothetical protein
MGYICLVSRESAAVSDAQENQDDNCYPEVHPSLLLDASHGDMALKRS